jgi:hypothetical protein
MDSTYDPATAGCIVKRTDEWVVSVIPMIFNDRITFSYAYEYPRTWTAAWCFDKGGAAALAAAAWDPDTEHEPVGYKKVAFDAR